MKKPAGDQAVVLVPIVVEPVEVHDPGVVVPVEVRDVQVAVGIPQKYVIHHQLHRPSNTLRVVFYFEMLSHQ